MPHLLNVWPRVSRQVAAAPHVLLLLDYDGTLAPIAPRPDLALLSSETRAALRHLIRRQRYSLGFVSGRGLADLTEIVGFPGLIYAGNHGLEIAGPNLEFIHPQAEELKPELKRILTVLQDELSAYAGVLVEGKGLTLSVHYRLIPQELRPEVQAKFNLAVAEACAAGKMRVTQGKEILEVRPNVPWDKGRAIARIASAFPADTLTVFFGDDLTDEDGFAAVHQLGGISVFVGAARQPTQAQYRLDSPQEVRETLKLLAD